MCHADDYKITDLQYFISDVILYHNGGKQLLLSADHGIHYVDARIPSTLQWRPADAVLPGTYDSLGFTFGINQAKNISGRFPNPPERDMAWPEILGGGYHYMKMNLVYRSPSATETKPFNFHLGIGQIYSSALPYPDSITGYIQNCFPVMLTGKIVVSPGSVTPVNCIMLVDKWFDGAESFNFESYPGGIMQYQAGMNKACINGRHAFMGSVND